MRAPMAVAGQTATFREWATVDRVRILMDGGLCMSEVMTKEQLLQGLAAAFEEVIQAATEAEERGAARATSGWGPREYVAHLAGWEVMATVRVPKVAAGMPPIELADEAQETVMNDAINATIVTMIGDQSLDTVCGILRQAYQRDVEILLALEDTHFEPGEYVYERTRNVLEHCQEHIGDILGSSGGGGQLLRGGNLVSKEGAG